MTAGLKIYTPSLAVMQTPQLIAAYIAIHLSSEDGVTTPEAAAQDMALALNWPASTAAKMLDILGRLDVVRRRYRDGRNLLFLNPVAHSPEDWSESRKVDWLLRVGDATGRTALDKLIVRGRSAIVRAVLKGGGGLSPARSNVVPLRRVTPRYDGGGIAS